MAIQPTEAQLSDLLENAGEGPIVMLNLLRFKERAAYADGRETGLTGAEAYALYGQGVAKLIHALGGRFIWGGAAERMVVGAAPLEWDTVALVEYPSVQAFLDMTRSEAYQEVHVHRDAGLAHQLLVQCRGGAPGAA